ncbi:signal peptidase I [Macrococcus carouselicus]|uniref:Signal peptidase I n=1 Tax=Macrococcus carouselicus TaxID=69969 RepID=A0A9Q8CL87_9STAP|nr:signal peptidase I [Macrococcus carouselicus]TDM02488.1 signal peptidase I [Macrococcus carouselicus]
MNQEIKEWLLTITISVLAFLIIKTFFFTQYQVSGESMSPTFHNQDRLVVSKIAKTMDTIQRGDVIIFHATKDKDYIKRLIGISGDTVEYRNDELLINGKKVTEHYLDENKRHKKNKYLTENISVKELVHSDGESEIPAGRYLVLGDNRDNSSDSRYELGLIHKKDVVGEVIVRLFPFDHMQYNFYPETFDVINE